MKKLIEKLPRRFWKPYASIVAYWSVYKIDILAQFSAFLALNLVVFISGVFVLEITFLSALCYIVLNTFWMTTAVLVYKRNFKKN